MQNEIKKRTTRYGILAILSAIILGSVIYGLGYIPQIQLPQSFSILRTFSSYGELQNFLTTNTKTTGAYTYLYSVPIFGGIPLTNIYATNVYAQSMPPALYASGTLSSVQLQYSTTNIQVSGVDEADVVKTDGEYIYAVTGNNVSISKAYPPEEAQSVSKITFNDSYPIGLYIDGDTLVVLSSSYGTTAYYYSNYIVDARTSANVYNISDRTNPQLLRTFTMTGNYFSSRTIGKYVYFVITQPTYVIFDTVILPKIYTNDKPQEVPASEIYHSNTSDNYYIFTTFVALNMQDTSEEPTHMSIMMGATSNMYVSPDNLYITFTEPDITTSIYRVQIQGNNLTCVAQGNVPGHELNQFSMDEYNGYFRIATTTQTNGTTQNNLYILDMNLTTVGAIENIAPGEALDSARFIGNRAYLATSVVRRDPFFVIDVENPTNPQILGYLKIPGFSRYLHPYDENHVIGVGKDENNKVKISLFDVSNVSAPTEMSRYSVEGTYSDTTVLTDQKAFLLDKSNDLLAIPVSEDNYQVDANGTVFSSQWQGALIFNVTLTEGLTLRGQITHQTTGPNYWDSTLWIKRTLYIEQVLYTVSDKKVKLNSLQDLTFIKEIDLS
jgi:inhibitor of cysteine peptidase